jgi:hypothetical protein
MTTRETTPRFVAEISLGNALLIATLLCGFVGHFVEVTIAGSQNTKDVEKLQTTTTNQITEVKNALTGTINDVKNDLTRQINDPQKSVSPLGVLDSRVKTLEGQMTDVMKEATEQDRLARGVRSDLDGIMRASQVPLSQERRR